MHKQIVALLAFGLSFAVGQTNFTISTQNLTDPSQNLPEFPCDYPSSGEQLDINSASSPQIQLALSITCFCILSLSNSSHRSGACTASCGCSSLYRRLIILV